MSKPVQTPANYVPQFAVSFANADGTAATVNTAAPLPVTFPVTTTAPLTGSTSASVLLGPFTPVVGRSVILTLSGTWSGSVQLLRSIDGGVNKLPLTMGGAPWALFTVDCCEAVWDESETTAQLYLQVTLSAGTLNYRMAQ
ncbi:hypothetical protein FHW96_001759 [Novosphingobium sp. SG751A]|uniref:hypothetical protein n=1 Tax=Novosphingobium sp. SG751A TaxID=2587000 RepID=UPI001554C444|nr:hypothetical protein [Novosphingobium sp. SG751A]NOW45604.1 hypothetical protein [Novosphingobium sp. SG751A]